MSPWASFGSSSSTKRAWSNMDKNNMAVLLSCRHGDKVHIVLYVKLKVWLEQSMLLKLCITVPFSVERFSLHGNKLFNENWFSVEPG